MNAYIWVNLVCGIVIAICEGVFLLLFRPDWKVSRRWWIIYCLYAQSVALLGLGIRLVTGILGRYLVEGHQTFWAIWNSACAILAASAVLVFLVGYLLGREWGRSIEGE